MSGKNEHAENFVLFLVIGGFAVAGILYVLFLFWPYFVFYVLPLLIGSLIVGGILRFITVSEKGSNGIIDYSGLGTVFPILIFIISIVFFANINRGYVLDERGNITATRLDWPEINKRFNAYRSSSYAGSPFDSLKAKARERVVYDRQEMGWISLWCLFFGGPLFFGYLSRRDYENNEQALGALIAERVGQERKRLEDKAARLNEIIESNVADLKEKIKKLENTQGVLLSENQVLKATVEFSTDIARPSESIKTKGILDKDIL